MYWILIHHYLGPSAKFGLGPFLPRSVFSIVPFTICIWSWSSSYKTCLFPFIPKHLVLVFSSQNLFISIDPHIWSWSFPHKTCLFPLIATSGLGLFITRTVYFHWSPHLVLVFSSQDLFSIVSGTIWSWSSSYKTCLFQFIISSFLPPFPGLTSPHIPLSTFLFHSSPTCFRERHKVGKCKCMKTSYPTLSFLAPIVGCLYK